MRAPAGMRTRNYTIMPRTGLTGVQYWRRGGLRGLGMNPHASGDTASAIIGPGIRSLAQPAAQPTISPGAPNLFSSIPAGGPIVPLSTGVGPMRPVTVTNGRVIPAPCPAYGCGPVMPRVYTNTPATTGGGSTAAQVAGTPVPAGYDINSVFIASNGSQWEFSSAQGKWIDVGTPYNLGTGAGVTPTPTPSASPTGTTYSTAAQVAGTPVPVGYPISSPYGDLYGNTWQFNPATGTWTETAIGSASSAALAAGGAVAGAAGSPIPAGTSTAAPYTDANGNTWVYDPATGNWQLASSGAAASPYSSILTWLSQSSLISPVPNWVIVVGVGFVALKFMQPGGRR